VARIMITCSKDMTSKLTKTTWVSACTLMRGTRTSRSYLF